MALGSIRDCGLLATESLRRASEDGGETFLTAIQAAKLGRSALLRGRLGHQPELIVGGFEFVPPMAFAAHGPW